MPVPRVLTRLGRSPFVRQCVSLLVVDSPGRALNSRRSRALETPCNFSRRSPKTPRNARQNLRRLYKQSVAPFSSLLPNAFFIVSKNCSRTDKQSIHRIMSTAPNTTETAPAPVAGQSPVAAVEQTAATVEANASDAPAATTTTGAAEKSATAAVEQTAAKAGETAKPAEKKTQETKKESQGFVKKFTSKLKSLFQ